MTTIEDRLKSHEDFLQEMVSLVPESCLTSKPLVLDHFPGKKLSKASKMQRRAMTSELKKEAKRRKFDPYLREDPALGQMEIEADGQGHHSAIFQKNHQMKGKDSEDHDMSNYSNHRNGKKLKSYKIDRDLRSAQKDELSSGSSQEESGDENEERALKETQKTDSFETGNSSNNQNLQKKGLYKRNLPEIEDVNGAEISSQNDEMQTLRKSKMDSLPKVAIDQQNIDEAGSLSIDDLREKLKKRIESMRSQRHASGDRKRERFQRREYNPSTKETRLEDSSFTKEKGKPPVSVPAIISDGKMVFSKFEFGASASKRHQTSSAPLHSALHRAEAQKQRLVDLRKQDAEKANDAEKQQSWNRALKLAQGEKIQDDPKLIKKTIKRDLKKKEKSAKAWQERKEKLQQDEEKKQTVRRDNLQQRRESSKKFQKKKRAGFEGQLKNTSKTSTNSSSTKKRKK